MSFLPPNTARFFFQTSALPPEVFEVARFEGTEGLSRPFRFTIDLFSQDPAIDFANVVGQAATFTLRRGREPLSFHGEVAQVQQFGRLRRHAAYRVVLVPLLERLRHAYRSHIYQHLSVREILAEVLARNGVTDVQFELSGTYDAREYCVQFEETDLAFVHRLMEHEGFYYYFRHTEDTSVLVVTDDHTTLQPIDGASRIVYDEGEGMVPDDVEFVHHVVCQERNGLPQQVELIDYNYETPNEYLDSVGEAPGDAHAPGTRGFRYEYGAHVRTTDEGDRLAAVRMDAYEGTRRQMSGESTCAGFRSGFLFTLENHYRSDVNADYLLVEVHHTGSQRQAMDLDAPDESETASGILYRNTFHCRPANVPYRPPRVTPVPRVPGLMVAHVDHPDRDPADRGHVDDYAHLDDQGRYQATIQFDAHREQTPAEHSLPIPMVQPYAGPDYGVHFPNHGGTQMLFACVNGDIDRPVALGTMPNPNHASPATAANRWQSVIRTWAQNELTFDDKKGEENIYMHATKDHTVVVRNDESISVGHDQSNSIGNDRSKSVGRDETTDVGNDRTETVGNDETIVIGNDRAEKVGNDESITIGNDRTDLVGHDEMRSVANDRAKTVGHDEEVTIGNDRTVTVVHDETFNVGNDATVTIQGAQEVAVGKDSSHTTMGERTMSSQGAMTVSSQDKIVLSAAQEVVITVGACSITLKPDGITLSGPKISATAVGIHEISGALIKIN